MNCPFRSMFRIFRIVVRQQRQAHDAGMVLCDQWLKKDILKTEWEQTPKEPRDCRFRQYLGSFYLELYSMIFSSGWLSREMISVEETLMIGRAANPCG